MPQPTKYVRQFNFTDFSTSNPLDQQAGVDLDAEYNHIKTTTDQVIDNLALIQRDDGKLANNIVTADALAAGVSAMLGVSTVWATATAYVVGDVVINDNAVYKCLIAHTSGVDFVDDWQWDGDWELIIDLGAAFFTATSATEQSVTISSKVFVTQAFKGFPVGSYVQVSSDSDPAGTVLWGQVTEYVKVTNYANLTVNVTSIAGSGSYSDWTIRFSGPPGAQGATGATGSIPIAVAGGTADAITADFTPDVTLSDRQVVYVVCSGANTITNPTFAPDGLTAHTITERGGQALKVGSIPGALFVAMLEYNSANTRWEFLNPAVTAATLGAALKAGGNAFTGQQTGGITALTSSSAHIATDLSVNCLFNHTFTENTTLDNPTNIVAGQTFTIHFLQHASSPKTLAYGSYFLFPSGANKTVTATNGAIDDLVCQVRSATEIHCSLMKGFA